MPSAKQRQKINTYFVDLEIHLGTYNSWCNRVKKVNCAGNLELLSSLHKIAVMGGRKLSNYGERVVDRIISDICVSGKLTIISGDLNGVERRVLGILENKNHKMILVTIKDIAVAADMYKKLITDGGLIISVKNLVPDRFAQVAAHDLMAALGKRVLFVEVGKDSNSLKTASAYFKKNLDVMIVPYPIENIYGDGGNKLLAKGVGRVVCDAEDVLFGVLDISIDIESNNKVIVGNQNNDVLYKAITEGHETVESMIQSTGLDIGEVFVRLQGLLCDKAVIEKNGKYFVA